MSGQRVPLDVVLGERTLLSPSDRAQTFVHSLHGEAVRRWIGESWAVHGAELESVYAEQLARWRQPIVTETDELAATLCGLVYDHLSHLRPDMPSDTRRRLTHRAVQVGILRLGPGLQQTYSEIAARPEVEAGSVRSLKADYALLLDSYLAAWRCGALPAQLEPAALRPSSE